MRYEEKLQKAVTASDSVLCVGLDPDPERIPVAIRDQTDRIAGQFIRFCSEVIRVTAPYCCAYKPNIAFFEALGSEGIRALEEVLAAIPESHVTIIDAKRSDIANTSNFYKKAFFDLYNADAVTLSPMTGFDSIKPFLDDDQKAVYVLTLTTNPGAVDFFLKPFEGFDTMSSYIASRLSDIDKSSRSHVGMVTGATQASHMKTVISRYPSASLLIPGIGAQGGSIEQLENGLKNHSGIPVINITRSLIYANDKSDWKSSVEAAAKQFRQKLEKISGNYV